MLSEAQVARNIGHAEEARPVSRTKYQKEVSLEEIVKDRTASPCSLREFMDYLVCEEQNAELLQFFAWFCGYVSRWSELSPQDKLLSPPWQPADSYQFGDFGARSGTPISVRTQRRARSDRIHQILTILDGESVTDNVKRISDQSRRKNLDPLNFSTPRGTSGTQSFRCPKEQELPSEDDAKRCAKQPFRQEVTQIAIYYLRPDTPRRLKIPSDDLADCLAALRTTTHPSAFLPAFTACETILKFRSHPSFVAGSRRNANVPRLRLIRLLGSVSLVVGFVLILLLVLSPAPPTVRAASLLLWWPGSAMLIAAARGVCVFLYARNLRQLRPWEARAPDPEVARTDKDDNKDEDGHIEESEDDCGGGDVSSAVSSVGEAKTRIASADETPTAPSTMSPRGSMQTFATANEWECLARKKTYAARSTRRKIWDDVVSTQNRAVRLWRDRTVLLAVCVGGLLSAGLTVASLFIPSVGTVGF